MKCIYNLTFIILKYIRGSTILPYVSGLLSRKVPLWPDLFNKIKIKFSNQKFIFIFEAQAMICPKGFTK